MLLGCAPARLATQQRAISDTDLFAFRWVAGPQISPDGKQVAYVLVTVNAKHDGYETSIWSVATDGASPPRRLTAGPPDGAPRRSPGSRTLALLPPLGEAGAQPFVLLLAGGEWGPASGSADGAPIILPLNPVARAVLLRPGRECLRSARGRWMVGHHRGHRRTRIRGQPRPCWRRGVPGLGQPAGRAVLQPAGPVRVAGQAGEETQRGLRLPRRRGGAGRPRAPPPGRGRAPPPPGPP